jgi:hypothetical protein
MRVNVTTGGYRCHRCGASSDGDDGVPLDRFLEAPQSPNLSASARKSDLPPLTEELVSRYHRILVDSPAVVTDLERKRGWTQETIERVRIGWDGGFLWIPIRDGSGSLVNARMYDPFKRNRTKSFHYANDDGLKRTVVWTPFGEESVRDHDSVWWFEGEPDAILAAQMGFPARVITGGAGTWTDEMVVASEGRRNVLCYDMDSAGRRGARSVKARMESHGRQVLHLEFALSDPASMKDFTDAVQRDTRSSAWFRSLAKDQWEGSSSRQSEAEPIAVKLGGGVPGEDISVKAHVLGTHTVPVLVPSMVEARCQMNWSDRCQHCPVFRANGSLRVEIGSESRDLMILASTPAKGHETEYKRLTGAPGRCPMVRFTVPGMWQVQHVKLIPPMSERAGGDSTMRSAVYVSPADGRPLPIRSNQLYQFNGKIEPDVLTNEWMLVSGEARPAEDDVESFRLDERTSTALSAAFRPDDWSVEAIERSVGQECSSLARHVTRIYGRDELTVAIDLCYHSVLSFNFRGRPIVRGWISLGVFGDTRTGKSETMSAMVNYLALGKIVMDPANTTHAGLVGGLQQVGKGDKAWTITWGLIPTNDKGLVVIDELSSLSTDDIGRMSGMRSSGVAEITKIRNSSTPARTRLIMAGNPRGLGKTLSSFSTPVEGFMELIGAPEDVARFDMVVAVKQGLDKAKADAKLGDQPFPASVEDRRSLVKFAWSRSPDQVKWADGAELRCTELSEQMAKDYSHDIPIVEPSEQDARLARMAVAAAVRTFSVDDSDNGVVVVRTCHVEFAHKVMEASYAGELGYRAHSEYLTRHRLDAEDAMDAISSIGMPMAVACRALMSVKRVNPNSIGMVLALDSGEARVFIARMAQNGAAKFDNDSRNSSMAWTPEFIAMLRETEKCPPPEKDGTKDLY